MTSRSPALTIRVSSRKANVVADDKINGLTRNCFHPLSRCFRACDAYTYTHTSYDRLGQWSGDRIDEGEKKLLNPTWFNSWIHWAAVWYHPKDISVSLKGNPDLKEEEYGRRSGFKRKRKEIPKARRTRERKRERKRNERKKKWEESLLWQYIRSPGVTWGSCWLTDSSCLRDIRAKSTSPSYIPL